MRPGVMMCHCVRHIDVDNKLQARSIRQSDTLVPITLEVGRLTRSFCAGTQDQKERPCGKKSSMGSENRQIFRCNLKSVPSALNPSQAKACGSLELVGTRKCVLLCVGLNHKSSFEYAHVRPLGEWLGWPQTSPREPLRCPISSLVIVETLKDSFEETQTSQTVLISYGHQ